MLKKVLFYCNTPFQLMMAIHLQRTVFKDDISDLIISDHIAQPDKIVKNAKKCGSFKKTYYFHDYHLAKKIEKQRKLQEILSLAKRKELVLNELPLDDNTYDIFLATDATPSVNWIFEVLLSKNKALKIFYFEEGPVNVICDHGNQFKAAGKYHTTFRHSVLKRFLNQKEIPGNYAGAYTSAGNEAIKAYFPYIEIPYFNPNELKEYISILNGIWEYQHNDIFRNKVIFFEESFFVDGHDNTDEQIVNDLYDLVGKEDLVVKLHPRTRVNRFRDIGIKTNQDRSVPWELIALNNDADNSVLISFTSGSAIHPWVYWGIKQNAICLAECDEYKFELLNSKYYQTYISFCKKRGLADIPQNKKEFIDTLKKQFDFKIKTRRN